MNFEQHVNQVADAGRGNLYRSLKNPREGLESENGFLYDGSGLLRKYSAVDNTAFATTLENLGELPYAEVQRAPDGTPKAVNFGPPVKNGGDWKPEFGFDYGPQGETGTQPLSNLDQVALQKMEIESLAQEAAPENTGFYSVGLIPNLMLVDEEFDDIIDWGMTGDTTTTSYRNPSPEYGEIEDVLGPTNMLVAGAQGLQVSGVPYVSGNLQRSDVDDILSNFLNGKGERPGIPAMNSIFYAATDFSPLISEGKAYEQHGRTEVYDQRFKRAGKLPNKVAEEKHGYVPKYVEVNSIEDIVRANSEEVLERTAPAPLRALEPLDGGGALQDRSYYNHAANDNFSVLLLDGNPEMSTHRDIVEEGHARGYVRIEDEDGETHREDVVLDLDRLEQENSFLRDNYLMSERMNKPNVRFRLGYGCFENRDQDSTPAWHPALGIHAAKMRNWEEFQRAAHQEGFQNSDAEYLRDQQRQYGVFGRLHPDTGMRIIDFIQEYEDLFTDALDEPRTGAVTGEYIDQLLEGEHTDSVKAELSYQRNEFDQMMERAKVA